MLAKAISVSDSIDFFDEERRALRYSEIVSSSEYLGIDAVNAGIIPVIDAYDCTYIVYLLKEDKWGKYNSVDKLTFMEETLLEDII